MEKRLLGLVIHDRDAFDKVRSFLDDTDFTEQPRIIYNYVGQYYDADQSATAVDIDWLCNKLTREYPKYAEQFIRVVRGLTPVSAPNVMGELLEVKRQAISHALAAELLANSPKVDELLEQYTTLSLGEEAFDQEDDGFNGGDIRDILLHTQRENRIQVLPHALNARIGGGAWRGAHIFIYARPNEGKTLGVINMACGFVRQGLTTLYIGNEDATVAMAPRFMSNLAKIPMDQLLARADEVNDLLIANRFNLLHFKHMNPGSIPEIDAAIRKVSPDVVIVDQLINLDSGKSEGVAAMDYLAKQLRRLYIKHNVLGISVGQAGESAANKAVLSMEDVYGSKTAIQAATDLMVGIGSDDVLKQLNRRMYSITKNKLDDVHEAFPVEFTTNINKVKSV